MKGIVSATFTGIKDTMNSLMSTANTLTGGKLDSIKSSFSTKLNGALSTVGSVMESIRAKFSEKMESAKTAVSNAIDRIKGFFNFEWSLPHLKLPHISISGSFSLTPPSVPHFGISWYKKAMDDGMIMNQPTIFGYNAKSNQFLAGGEAGSETVVGTQSLMDMIRGATHDGVVDEVHSLRLDLNTLIEFLYNWLPQLANLKLVTDTGVLAGELAPAMDEELGKIFDKEGRR